MSDKEELYDIDFYKEQSEKSYASAKMFVPSVLKYCNFPQSVIDIGCGVGTWLRAFSENGVKTIRGIDGNNIEASYYYIDKSLIQQNDLNNIQLNTDKKFDLAISLEVAEHLPAASAKHFIDALCSYSDTILFSAAVPYQGGTEHINEQPPAYWFELFKEKNYYCFDILRKEFINNEELPYGCYAQNAFIYTCKPEYLLSLGKNYEKSSPMFFYHPWYVKTYYSIMKEYEMRESELLKHDTIYFSITKDNNKIKFNFNDAAYIYLYKILYQISFGSSRKKFKNKYFSYKFPKK